LNDPGAVEAALERARALVKARDLDAAARLYAGVLAADPARAEAWFMQGVVHAEKGELAQARSHMGRAFELQPVQPPANHLVHANVLLDAGDFAAAEMHARKALEAAAGWPPAMVALGLALHRQGNLAQAVEIERWALAADPGYQRGHTALAAALVDSGAFEAASGVLRAALERWPADALVRQQLAQAHWRFARSLHQSARVFDAIDAYRAALAIDDAPADYWNDLANACADAGLLKEAQRCYRETLRRKPEYHQVESNLLINLHYDPAFGADAMFEAHRDWARRHADALRPSAPPPRRSLAPGARLRVGFLSPGLHWGASGIFALPLLENLDPAKFELCCYRVGGAIDPIAERIRRRAFAWHDLVAADDAAIADRIRKDSLDVLVDLAGHTPGGRLLVLARKPAPVIATWLDYFDTTGLETVDYLIGDPVSTPAGASQRFSETVVRIDPCRLCYAPPEYAPAVAAPPCVRNGHVTFGSFNRVPKLAPPVIALWSRVLDAVPGSRLLLKNAALVDLRTRERLANLFAEHGIDRARLELRSDSPHSRMLGEYGDIDIALDPFPYNGGLTTCEALWMGVPVLALMGGSMISRQSASLLAAAGLVEWVAADEDELIRMAARWAGDTAALALLRRGMRERLLASPLLDARRFALRFGESLAAMATEAPSPRHPG
jgi:predicted O-linked N-acetylglucosamine transferase (SPINDLY family)